VTSQGARRPGGRLPPGQLWAGAATAPRPPQGEEPREGWLRTRVPGGGCAAARTVGQWSRARWAVALFSRVRKRGGPVERLRWETAHRRLTASAIELRSAWRLHPLTRRGRASPGASGAGVFEPHEGQTISTMQSHSRPPAQPPPGGTRSGPERNGGASERAQEMGSRASSPSGKGINGCPQLSPQEKRTSPLMLLRCV
jgi:hypothetical protein